MSEKQLTLPVIGMTCANCVAAVERNAKKAEGVTDATVNFAAEKVTVSYDLEKVAPGLCPPPPAGVFSWQCSVF